MTEFVSRWLTWEPPETQDVGSAKSANTPISTPRTSRAGGAKGAKSPSGTFGTARSTHSQGNTAEPAVPDKWAAAVARLQQMDCPAHVTPERWQQVLTDAQRLLVDWTQTLLASGWLIEDVFGREPDDPQSVVWWVRGQTIWTVVSENSDAVVLRGADGRQTFIYRRADK